MKTHFGVRAILFCLLTFAVLVGNTTVATGAGSPRSEKCLVYVGTYTGAKSKGIYAFEMDLGSGALKSLGLAGETASPSFVAIHPNRRFLYSVGESDKFDGKPSGSVSAFEIDSKTGKLKFLNQKPSVGAGPCHLVVDKTGKTVLIANYSGGSATALSIGNDGRLGETSAFIQHTGSSVNSQRQKEPHAHGVYFDAANRFAFVPDLGLDRVMIYRFDAKNGSLSPNDPAFASIKPGSGPRHFAFHPNGRFAYVIDEMACTVVAFHYDAKRGALEEIQSLSTLPDGESVKPSYSTAEIFVHPSGKFLYGSNRGHNTIVSFAIDPKDGKLRHIENVSTQGKTPRSFAIDPTGNFLLAANQDTDNVVEFKIDKETGHLTPTGTNVEAPAPVCLVFMQVK